MKMSEAKEIIDGEHQSIEKYEGFMVCFDRRENGFLFGEFFPERTAGDELIKSEEEAWSLARDFARKASWAVNIYVMDHHYQPVDGYKEKMIKNR
jgi:glycosylphosphatidylinositol transamidase (GPIT) subunit GPI8